METVRPQIFFSHRESYGHLLFRKLYDSVYDLLPMFIFDILHPTHKFYSFFRYGKKRSSERYLKFDPCPSSTEMNSDQFLRGLQSLHGSCMWENLIFFTYEDYDLDNERKAVLHRQVKMFEDGLGNDIDRYSADTLSSDDGVHVSGSEEQSLSGKKLEGFVSLHQDSRSLQEVAKDCQKSSGKKEEISAFLQL
jgi:hypothetical protein